MDEGIQMKIEKEDWVWYGHACHLVVGRRCAYHLGTRVGEYLISTVGAFHPSHNSEMETIGSGEDDYYETMIFECDGEDEHGNPNIISWSEIGVIRYGTSEEAKEGHHILCNKYSEQ